MRFCFQVQRRMEARRTGEPVVLCDVCDPGRGHLGQYLSAEFLPLAAEYLRCAG